MVSMARELRYALRYPRTCVMGIPWQHAEYHQSPLLSFDFSLTIYFRVVNPDQSRSDFLVTAASPQDPRLLVMRLKEL